MVVDEMQSMPGVDYETMLSELGKFGASFILATQGLAKLGDLSRTMQDSIMSNVGCLADITSLPVHHCYVRATVEKERLPAFSMAVRKPEAGDPEVAARIRAATAGYTTPVKEIAAGQAESERLVEQYRAAIAALERGNKTPPSNGAAPKTSAKGKRRSRPPKDTTPTGAPSSEGKAHERGEGTLHIRPAVPGLDALPRPP